MLFALRVREQGGWKVVEVTGELELATAPRLRQEMVSLSGTGASRVVVDLTGVDFIDSVGLGVVVGGLKRTRGRGGDLRVVAPDGPVRSLFALTRLDEVIVVAPTLEEVLGARRPAHGDPPAGRARQESVDG